MLLIDFSFFKCLCLSLKLRIYAQPSQIKTAEYAANTTKIIFDYFEDYFNMSYSIAKLGMFHIRNTDCTTQSDLPLNYSVLFLACIVFLNAVHFPKVLCNN